MFLISHLYFHTTLFCDKSSLDVYQDLRAYHLINIILSCSVTDTVLEHDEVPSHAGLHIKAISHSSPGTASLGCLDEAFASTMSPPAEVTVVFHMFHMFHMFLQCLLLQATMMHEILTLCMPGIRSFKFQSQDWDLSPCL